MTFTPIGVAEYAVDNRRVMEQIQTDGKTEKRKNSIKG